MPDQLQLRGGTTTEHNSFTGAAREVTVDTTKKTLVVHDGSTQGGTPLMKESGTNQDIAIHGLTVGRGNGAVGDNTALFLLVILFAIDTASAVEVDPSYIDALETSIPVIRETWV